MSNVKWGLLIAATIVVDLIQIGLDVAFGSGLVINRFVDVAVAGTLLLIFRLQKVELTPARTMSIVGVMIAEFIPVVDILPFWTADVIYIFASTKKAEVLQKLGPVGDIAQTATSLKKGNVTATENIEPTVHSVPLSLPDNPNVANPNVIDLRDK